MGPLCGGLSSFTETDCFDSQLEKVLEGITEEWAGPDWFEDDPFDLLATCASSHVS